MDVNSTSNYLTNSVVAAQRFAGQVMSKMQEGIERKPWGQYKSAYGPVRETVTQAIKDPAKTVAVFVGSSIRLLSAISRNFSIVIYYNIKCLIERSTVILFIAHHTP